MKRIKSITDVITNSSNETYVIRRDRQGSFPPCDWSTGGVFDYDIIRGSEELHSHDLWYDRIDIIDMLEVLGKTLIYPEGQSRDLWRNSEWKEDQELWRIFVDVNREAFMELSEYQVIYGPEDHYEDYEYDWDKFREMSIHTDPR